MDTLATTTRPSRRVSVRRSGSSRRPPVLASIVVLLFLVAAVAPGLLAPTDPNATSLTDRLVSPSWFSGPHPLGTDGLGRDVLSRIVHGAGYSAIVALAAIVLAGLLGVAAGTASGFAPRPVAATVMRLADAALGIPLFLVALTLAVARGPGLINVVLVVGGLLWAQYARVVGAEVAKVRNLSYIDASRVLGTSTWVVVLRHVLPNLLPTVITLLASQIGSVILLEASLSFLGAGVPPPAPAWGTLVADGRDFIATAWWISALPGVAIVLVVVALNSLADWLRHILDPRNRQARVALPAAPAGDAAETSARAGSADLAEPALDPAVPGPSAVLPPLVAVPPTAPPAVSPGPAEPTDVNRPVLLDVAGLTVRLVTSQPSVTLVDGIDLRVHKGEFVGLIGESGSGKSLTALSLVRLLPPAFEVDAERLRLGDTDVAALDSGGLRRLRGGRVGFVFQDHTACLDPTATVGRHLTEVLRRHRGLSRAQARREAVDLLDSVGIPDPRGRMSAYPHQFSGGMGQRVALAAALAGEPELIIADEPTTALDATVQERILDLLANICAERDLSMLLITHDLGVARKVCDRISVMYSGRIVESGPTSAVLESPRSPYTRALLGARPALDADRRLPLGSIVGAPPPAGSITAGCRFAARCSLVQDRCRTEEPALAHRSTDGHTARCWATEPGGWSA